MMSQAFYTGISGLRAGQQAIDVISDNIGNVSTTAFRSSSTEFSNLFSKAINTNSGSSSVDSGVGVGTKLSAIVMDEARGVFKLTDRANDLAILGDGWFGVEGNNKTVYTRDGSFSFDSNRDLVTQDGFYVLGTMGKNVADGVLTESLIEIPLTDASEQEKLSFPKELYFPPIPTTEASFYGNLSLNDTISTISATVINSEGAVNNLRVQFTKTIPQVLPGVQWDISASTESKDGTTVYSTTTGKIAFGETGVLVSNTLGAVDNQGTPVNINFEGGPNKSPLISIQADSSTSSEADGLRPGELLGYEINRFAEVVATFTNGRQSNVGSIAIFHFSNDRGLEKLAGSKYTQSDNSGEPTFYKDDNGKNVIGTSVTNYKLEGSNVRLDVGLTEIIVMQRSFDANSKSITTADQMLQKALSMDA